jgi:CBS domain-containing protein
VIAGFQTDFPVVDQGRLVGVLTKTDLLKSLAQKGPQQQVSEVMRRDFERADPADMLDGVLAKLQSSDCHSIPIVRRDNLVGIVTMENVGEFLAIQSAVRQADG